MSPSDKLRPEEEDIIQHVEGLPIDLDALAVMSNIWRASQSFKLFMDRSVLQGFELTWASFSTLFIVWIWGPIEIREIARRQVVTRPTVTSNVDALEARGLCKRRASETDKRLVTVELTSKGKVVIEKVFVEFNKGEKQIASSLSAEEQQAAASLLRKIVAGTPLITDKNGP